MKSADTPPLLKRAGLAPLTGRECPRAPTPDNRSAQAGFLLPLSVMGALLLVTGNVALQLADLQAFRAQAVDEERNSDNDQLISAAHLIGDYITPPRISDPKAFRTEYSCLSPLPFNQWSCRISDLRPVVNASSLATTVNKFMTTSSFAPIAIKNWIPIRESAVLIGGYLTLESNENNIKQQKTFYIRFPAPERPSIATEQQT